MCVVTLYIVLNGRRMFLVLLILQLASKVKSWQAAFEYGVCEHGLGSPYNAMQTSAVNQLHRLLYQLSCDCWTNLQIINNIGNRWNQWPQIISSKSVFKLDFSRASSSYLAFNLAEQFHIRRSEVQSQFFFQLNVNFYGPFARTQNFTAFIWIQMKRSAEK